MPSSSASQRASSSVKAGLAGLQVLRQRLQAIARLGELGGFLVELGHAIIGGIPLGPQPIELGLHRPRSRSRSRQGAIR
jgi:hypothetical protein